MDLTKRERRKLKSGTLSQESHKKNIREEQVKDGKSKYYVISFVIGIIILVTAVYSVYSINKPGQYDDFAKCLNEKGAVMYGAMDWCKFTQAQKAMFGKSFKYLNYHEHTDLPGIKKTPTWVISGQWYENVQPFEKLSTLTGCKL